jgi:hypothetical protein
MIHEDSTAQRSFKTTNLNCKCADCCNHVQATTQHAVAWLRWVVFPDCTGGFDSGKFCDVGHNIHIDQVDDMLKTSK